jgi:hypothetical protein
MGLAFLAGTDHARELPDGIESFQWNAPWVQAFVASIARGLLSMLFQLLL